MSRGVRARAGSSGELRSPSPDPMSTIAPATSAEEIATVRELLQDYGRWLGVDLGFQGFAAELAGLPGAYAPPRGRLFLASAGGRAAGCGAFRSIDERVCEMKRLFVRPGNQGQGLGRMLA